MESTLMLRSVEAGILPKYFHAYHKMAACSPLTEILMQSATGSTTLVLHSYAVISAGSTTMCCTRDIRKA